jgi:hypothetical protein
MKVRSEPGLAVVTEDAGTAEIVNDLVIDVAAV